MLDEDLSERVCESLTGSYCADDGCKGCTRTKLSVKGRSNSSVKVNKKCIKKLDTEDSSWYKESVENNISASNSTSTEKEETIMSGKTENAAGAEETNSAGAGAEEATFGKKIKACCKDVKGPAGWLLAGMALLAGVQIGTKAYKEHQANKDAAHSAM